MAELIVLDSWDWTLATLDFQKHGGDIGEVLRLEEFFQVEPLAVTALR